MGGATGVRGEDGSVPASAGPMLPDYPGTGSGRPRSLEILKERMPDLTAGDVIEFLGHQIIDVFEENLPVEKAKVANASVGRMLKAAEMQERYGRQVNRQGDKKFSLRAKPTAIAAG